MIITKKKKLTYTYYFLTTAIKVNFFVITLITFCSSRLITDPVNFNFLIIVQPLRKHHVNTLLISMLLSIKSNGLLILTYRTS